ncbi:hypothetical protein Tco_0471138 [Tanacetum coccineum]
MSEAEPIPPTSSVTALRIPMIKKALTSLHASSSAPKTSLAANARRNNEKALNILLSAIPDRHLLSFHDAVDARTLWLAIKARFGGNEASKKMQKCCSSGSKSRFETMGLDDLYNNFKIVEQKVKRTVAVNNDDKNLAFLTTTSPSSTNSINTANTGVSTGNSKVNTASAETSTASFSDATAYAFLSSQPQGSQLVHEDLEQIHDDDLEEMDLKWNMALLSMRARKFYQRTGRKDMFIDGIARECRVQEAKTTENWTTKKLSKSSRMKMRPIEPKKARENTDAPIIEDWVSDDEEEVVSIPKKEKKANYSNLSKCFKHMVPRAVLMRTGLKTVKNAKPLSTAKSVNTVRPSNSQLNEKGFVDSGCSRHMSGNKSSPSDLHRIDGRFFMEVFFLRTKDETSEILKNFIKEIENLVDKKVKIIRSDNGTEFKNM